MPKDPIWQDTYDCLSAPWSRWDSNDSKSFITCEELRNAWSGKLETFANVVGLGLSKSDLGIVTGKFLKMLSILIMIGYTSMPKFKANFLHHKDRDGRLDRTDECLPVPKQVLQAWGRDLQPHEAQHFNWIQYRFIPIILEPALEPLVLDTRRPLPFVNPNPPCLGSGAGGSVYKEVIAARCLRTAEGSENPMEKTVARKSMEPQDAEDEIQNLKKCRESDITHKNIMTYLCIYKAEKKVHILYECAETDLEKLLHGEEYQSSIPSSASIIPLLTNASALAKALQFLHSGQWDKKNGNWIGCHMDLKPSNILVFKTEADTTWKISDLGISRFQSDPHDFRQPRRATKETTKTYARRSNGKYQAPEVHEKHKIGRKSDIWSLGCILIIITVRAVQSLDGLTKFTDTLSDKYDDDYFHHDGKLKPEVDKWLSALAFTDSPYVAELAKTLKIPAEDVTTMMKSLEISIREMLDVEDASRCNAEQACRALQNLSFKLANLSKAYPGMKRDIEAALRLEESASGTTGTLISGANRPLTQNRSQMIVASELERSQNILPEADSFVQKELLAKMTQDKNIPDFQVAQRTQSQLKAWLKPRESTLLCISGSQSPTSMHMISKCVYAAAIAHSWTAVTYISPQPSEIERTPRELLCRVTNSFISQLLNDKGEGQSSNPTTGVHQLRAFGNNDEDITIAVQMISELLAQRTRSCIFLVDNFRMFCPQNCESAIKGHWQQMLQMLQRSTRSKQQESPGVAFKGLVRATGNVEMLESLGATFVRVDGNGPPVVNLKRSLDSCFESSVLR